MLYTCSRKDIAASLTPCQIGGDFSVGAGAAAQGAGWAHTLPHLLPVLTVASWAGSAKLDPFFSDGGGGEGGIAARSAQHRDLLPLPWTQC